MKSRMSSVVSAAVLAVALVLGGALPASAAPGDWEEYDSVTGLTTPSGVAVMEGTPTLLYVTEPDASAIAVLNADTLEVLDEVVFDGMEPRQILVDPDTGVVYFVDAASWAIVRWDPSVTPVATTEIVVGHQITGFDLAEGTYDPTYPRLVWAVIDDGTGHGHIQGADANLDSLLDEDLGAGVQPAGLDYFVATDDTVTPPLTIPVVLVTDPASGQIFFASMPLPIVTPGLEPVDIDVVFDEAGLSLIAIANYGDDTVTIATQANPTPSPVAVGDGPVAIEYVGASGPIFVINNLSGTVSILEAPFTSVGWTIPVGLGPLDGDYSSALQRYFVASPGSGAVVSIAQEQAPTTPVPEPELAATGTDSTGPLLAAIALTLFAGVLLASRRRSRVTIN